MEKNPYLKSAQKVLKQYHTTFRDENLLEISLDQTKMPFAFLVIEKEQFPGVVISIAVDYSDCYCIADMIINLMHIAPIALGEPFFINSQGNIFWNEDALQRFEAEQDPELLKDLTPINNNLH